MLCWQLKRRFISRTGCKGYEFSIISASEYNVWHFAGLQLAFFDNPPFFFTVRRKLNNVGGGGVCVCVCVCVCVWYLIDLDPLKLSICSLKYRTFVCVPG